MASVNDDVVDDAIDEVDAWIKQFMIIVAGGGCC